jgi:membrane protein DedA with SNARE-associated domain
MGLTVDSAATFAFLLAVPALCGALAHSLVSGATDLQSVGDLPLLIGFLASFVSSITIIHRFLSTIRRYGVWMWSVYLFVAAAIVLSDEMLPMIRELPHLLNQLDFRVVAGTLFLAMLLESAPFTSFFVPGMTILIAVSLFLRGDWWNLIACIPIAATGVILGSLLGYIPARQARLQIRWKEKADERLTRAEHLLRKWGVYAVFFGVWIQPIRPWISIAAGIGGMRPLPYFLSMIGGAVAISTIVISGCALFGEAVSSFF